MNNRDRDFRPNRRRSFDDDNYEPPRRNFGFAPPSGPLFETPTGPSIRGTVKWYNPEKGFGFVQLADRSSDAPLTWYTRAGSRPTWPSWRKRASAGRAGFSVELAAAKPAAAEQSTSPIPTAIRKPPILRSTFVT